MATRNLTAAAIAELHYEERGPSRQVLWDATVRGLGVRVTPAQGRQYVLSYRFHGRSRLMSLGRVEDFRNVNEARDLAREQLRQVRMVKVDPLIARQRDKAAGTVKEMFDRWLLAVAARRSPRTHAEYRYQVESRLIPEFGRHRPADVTRPEVRRMHARLTEKNGPIAANRIVTTLRAAYGWTLKQDDATLPAGFQNPAQGIELNREKPRDEFLRPDELPAVVGQIQAVKDPWQRSFLWLLMLTGARSGELLNLKWSDVSLKRGEITLRETKNRTDLRLQLSGAAVEVLRQTPHSGAYVFPPLRRDGESPHMRKPRATWIAVLKRAGITRRVTLHDVRRSAGVLLSKKGFTAEQIARQLNHKSNITAKVYVRIADELQQEMAEALAGGTRAVSDASVSTLGRNLRARRS